MIKINLNNNSLIIIPANKINYIIITNKNEFVRFITINTKNNIYYVKYKNKYSTSIGKIHIDSYELIKLIMSKIEVVEFIELTKEESNKITSKEDINELIYNN